MKSRLGARRTPTVQLDGANGPGVRWLHYWASSLNWELSQAAVPGTFPADGNACDPWR